nr:hypothetical protein [Tanacetum cinerariifolium]
MNVPYVRRMIPEPGDPDREVPVAETFHEHPDEELTKKEVKQIETDDQAIQTILMGSDIGNQEKKAKLFNEWERFTSTDGESTESYYHCFSKLMNDFKRNKHFLEKIDSNIKFLNNLQPEWSRHVIIVHQKKDLHTTYYTQLYDFLKYNQKDVNELRAKRLARAHDPLALMANSNNPYNYPVFHQDQPSPFNYMQQPHPNNNFNPQPSFNQKYMKQPMINLKDIFDPTTAMNMALVLIVKEFKLNYSTPTNNNQIISSNPRNRQVAQPVQNVRNQVVHNAVQNPSIQNVKNHNGLIIVLRIDNPNANQTGNGNVVAARAEGNANKNNGDLYKVEKVNASCILMANLQQTSTSSTQTDSVMSMIKMDQLRVQNFKIQFLKEAVKFVRDFKSLAKEADESLAKHKALEFEIGPLLRAVVSQDIMSIVQSNLGVDTSNLQTELKHTKERFENCIIKKENEYAKHWNDWYKKCEECKYDKISYDKAYNDMQQKIEWLQAQLGDQKGKRVDNTAKTRRPQPRSNIKNDRVPSASKSSCIKNKEVEVEEHHRNLLLSKNKKHMSSEYLGCSKHKTGNLKLLINFVWKFLGTVCFGIDHVATIMGYGDLQWGRNRTTNLYTINLYEMAFASLICLMARATSTKSWSWHHRLSHLNFDTINDLAKKDLVTEVTPSPYGFVWSNDSRNHQWALCYPNNDHEDIGKLGAKDTTPTPTNSSSQATNIPNTSQDVDELEPQQQHVQQQENQALIQPKIVADNVLNAMIDGNMFVNPFASPSTSAAESSSSQYVDPSNMHTFYQPYPHEYLWTKDQPLKQTRLVVRGCRQEEGIDFEESFAPVAIMEAIRIFLAYAAHQSFIVFQMDVKTAFLHGTIDPTLFIKRFDDDILVSNYVLEILKKYGMKTCDLVRTPMEIKDKLDLDKNGTLVDATKYRSMIGALMYLTSSRPDIVHATCLRAQYQAKPTEKHLKE